ncbi:threonylcarbamoyl-AMP synthase [Halalkalicoccus paucihalophilus]|uniref:L-threonylcarbamoyladenylate synthase n=1 Tax=Halalkalicoccus paucihalophilus TaxID=1008153 RepID=A0A151AHF4_9EURY|nr:L-threonylcarbamoyladenylate synthase [Halalkalicoccus paucihalophilus]KYH27076.1 threonylcarbamoyl-AMP synthase [Halalkalicoccus paucihalophilus]
MKLNRAVRSIRTGDLVVYPTETVYGLGADALDPDAVERVYEAKGRARSKPLSMAVPDVETAARHTKLTECERGFMREFLPGPVTVVVEAGSEVPEELTAGRERVGIRIPDHDLALSLLREVSPITATSANVSGNPSVRRTADLDPAIHEAVAGVLDGGETGGTESTVVDVERGGIHRRGALADEIETWLEAEQ